ncbi:MAG: nucleotidyltransferase domain-containing protein [Dehalococcoidales bacterium]|nr:nucleotidyltransferase domain-containing protein [Dehalococcoidales bacterium]
MRQEEVLSILKRNQTELRSLGVRSLALFGSVARNEASLQSDVDLLVEIERPMGLFGLLRIQHFIEQLLGGAEVDLVVKESILDELKDDIMEDAVRVI